VSVGEISGVSAFVLTQRARTDRKGKRERQQRDEDHLRSLHDVLHHNAFYMSRYNRSYAS
jgi:hypothetical protein